MRKLSGNEVRTLFLEYFQKQNHMVEPSASLIPFEDNTLLWINSGVAALKKYFDGTTKPKNNRITNAQKSIRTNDIENVGYTARHHTFFEMLGNFSIGDYFKKEAIHFAWEFLTSQSYIGFEKDKLYITVHDQDEEAYSIWVNEIGVLPSHILKTEHNFWQIGEGPSGPNSEIFYDRGAKYDPENKGEALFFDEEDNDRYIEVWNIVFSQYDAKEGIPRSEFKELPQKNIDTGMGLERLVCIIQDVETNFDTDLFMPIINETEKLTTKKYVGEYKMAYRVIADHIRTLVFALGDGASFSNEGRGYVLRRILRRAVRFGRKLEIESTFLHTLVDTVFEIMKDYYPYLSPKLDQIKKLIKQEEEKFHVTLADGEKMLSEMLKGKTELSGEDAFKLYDTYGFPFELTLEIAQEHNVKVSKQDFEKEMEIQRERARNSRSENASFSSQSKDLMNFTAESEFVGYDELTTTGKIIGIFKDGETLEQASGNIGIILDKTSFYATSGGQEHDKGTLTINNHVYPVLNVIKAPHKQHIHYIDADNTISVGDEVTTKVDSFKRERTSQNHSATHLLQSALKKYLGNHVAQAGSFNNDEYLRFDFNHFEKISPDTLQKIENYVNEEIKKASPVEIEYMGLEEAKKSGANALFNEKYGDIVRVVTMGEHSKELCGGTHVSNTKDIQQFKLTSEESVGSGIRRISAITADAVTAQLTHYADLLIEVKKEINAQSEELIIEKIKLLQEELKQAKKENLALSQKLANFKIVELLDNAKVINSTKIIITQLENTNVDTMKKMVDSIKTKQSSYFVFFASEVNEKIFFVAAASDDVVKTGIHCGNIVKEAAVLSGGNGGGKPNLATAGGKHADKLKEIFELVNAKFKGGEINE